MFCEFCYEQFEQEHGNQKYCKKCAKDAYREKSKQWKKRQRGIGTSDFFEHAHVDDFEREYSEICTEIKKLGFKRQFS